MIELYYNVLVYCITHICQNSEVQIFIKATERNNVMAIVTRKNPLKGEFLIASSIEVNEN